MRRRCCKALRVRSASQSKRGEVAPPSQARSIKESVCVAQVGQAALGVFGPTLLHSQNKHCDRRSRATVAPLLPLVCCS